MLTPKKALKILKKGLNYSGPGHCPAYDPYVYQPIAGGQTPIAAIVSCADSRVVPEEIFSAPPGALFVARGAGNVADPVTIASLEYAVAKLKVPLIIVLGHQNCGAVKAAKDFCLGVEESMQLTPDLYHLIAEIFPALNLPEGAKLPLNKLAKQNVAFTTHNLTSRSDLLAETVEDKELKILPAYFNLKKDKMVWLEMDLPEGCLTPVIAREMF